ncbi:NAD(P)-binding protein [Ramicandelaber brevisporus]|nr:NAD(P)-binding protein [Ramicandelaber brevisporus]
MIRIFVSVATGAYQVFFGRGVPLTRFGAGKPGHWAVITGATDGIGKAFAKQLAKNGFNIFLVSRSEHKLVATREELTKKYGVKTLHHAFDFSRRDDRVHEEYAAMAAALQKVTESGEEKVAVLINNVGVSHDMPIPFVDLSDAENEKMVEVNIMAMMKMTRIVGPLMIKNKNGLIINVGSFAAMVPTPLLSVYSGTKAFVSTWTKSIAAEFAEDNIVVQHLNTFFVVSAMSKIRKAKLMVPTAEGYVKHTLDRIGVSGGASDPYESTPYPPHALLQWMSEHLHSRKHWYDKNYVLQKELRMRALAKLKAKEENDEKCKIDATPNGAPATIA